MLKLNGEGEITIGGQKRKVVIQNKTLAMFMQDNGDSFRVFHEFLVQINGADIPVNKLTDFLYASLYYGAKGQVDFSKVDVLDWVMDWIMDSGKKAEYAHFVSILEASLPQTQPDPVKKK